MYPNERGTRLFLRALGTRGIHPETIASINVDYSLSNAIRSSLQLPVQVEYRHRKSLSSTRSLHDELFEKLEDLESEIDDVKDQLD